MHIKEIIVEGFKSYANRTVITGFDPHFNAITGLNGSGKSNVLDSICFVLGITNLSQVRAGNLTELIYKQGQAGINRATVTVVFDNAVASGSPVGYESEPEVTVTRQIQLGGSNSIIKSKYFINGKVSPASKVTNLFHSVQLNVNNPHFLIMQGRITKVLNMGPEEILGMVEEAAGTRMYESKRVAAIATIEKKQAKLDELNEILTEEIGPTLVRLREEKRGYLQWSRLASETERLERFVVASEYWEASQFITGGEKGSGNNNLDLNLEEQLKLAGETEALRRQELADAEAAVTEKSAQVTGELDEARSRCRLTEEALSKDLVVARSAWQNCEKVASEAKEELECAQAKVQETERAVEDANQGREEQVSALDQARTEANAAEELLIKLKEEQRMACAGIAMGGNNEDGDGEGSGVDDDAMAMTMTLPDRISKACVDASDAESRAKQAAMKIRHLTKSMGKVQSDMKKKESSAAQLSAKREVTATKVKHLEEKLERLGFDPEAFASIEDTKGKIESRLAEVRTEHQSISAQLEGRLSLDYTDPVRGFDRSKVKGLVARLVRVDDAKYATALEVTAGGKLGHVVVDEALTGKALLGRGQLKRRVTIIPLDVIKARRVPQEKCRLAADTASRLNTTSHAAIELVGFDEEVRNAMEYVFGSTLVVDGMDAANKVCDMTKVRTVTLDGDVYDPSGTISGGSSKGSGMSTLHKLAKVVKLAEEMSALELELKQVTENYDKLLSKSDQHGEMTDLLEVARAELSSVDRHLSQTSFGMLQDKLNAMEAELSAARQELELMQQKCDASKKLYETLKNKEKDLTAERERRLETYDGRVRDAKAAAEEATAKFRDLESRAQQADLELESLQKDLKAARETVQTAQTTLQDATSKEVGLQIALRDTETAHNESKDELNKIQAAINEASADLKQCVKQRDKLNNLVEAAVLECKRLTVKHEKLRKGREDAKDRMAKLRQSHPWIEDERHHFGVQGGDYDFEAAGGAEVAASRLTGLREEQAVLSRKINRKVMGMIEKAEAESNELFQKRSAVEKDKRKIQAVMESLDVKKKAELQRTWVKVNRDFGSIFSTLLPGAMAKLEPPEGLQAWEGLQVKVAFDKNVWKESLSELSGGQRSLLALSLILSLLLYKPAPMYILDEVDAALDLSHTQNIGNMLKTHFSQSQFIVVSLKEGMFQNANVIFRTKFVDGVSTVSRTIGTGSSVDIGESQSQQDENEYNPTNKKNNNNIMEKSLRSARSQRKSKVY